MRMPFGPILCAAGAACALASCGGTEDPPEIPGSARAGEPLTITAREYLFTPNRITVRGADHKPFTQPISLRNQGELAHNIEILDGDRTVARLRSFPAGQTRELRARLGPGTYDFVCTVADHDEKGMRGTIAVR
jgi:plastocyanin